MRSKVLVVAYPNRLPHIEVRGALAARCTSRDTVHLVSAAANPLGGDSIDIRVIVEEGGRLRLRSAAAAVALPGRDVVTSHARWEVAVAGSLDIDLEPTVVAGDARHLSSATFILHHGAQIRFRERVQIGRWQEREGFWSGSLHADRDDRPLLRHRMELGAGSLADDGIAFPRAVVSEFRYPSTAFPAVRVDDGSTVLALAGGGTLSTWQAERLAG